MKVTELVAKAKETLGAQTVYAEPVERDGVIVIAAASVMGGAGGGTGKDKAGEEGEGGGFGMRARPTGAWIIRNGNVTWQPAVDVNRALITVGAIVVASLFVGARIARIKAR